MMSHSKRNFSETRGCEIKAHGELAAVQGPAPLEPIQNENALEANPKREESRGDK